MDASSEPAPTPAGRETSGGGSRASTGRHGVLARVVGAIRASTWAPVLGRAAGIAAGMVALAGIGAASTLSGSGVPVASAAPAASVSSTTNTPHVPVAQSVAPATSGAAASSVPAPAPSAPSPGGGVTADGKIVLNEATADELTKLPRVGPKRAQAIIDLRHHLGRFHQPTDLLRVKGIGRKTLRLMLPLLVVDAKPPSQN